LCFTTSTTLHICYQLFDAEQSLNSVGFNFVFTGIGVGELRDLIK